MLKNTNADYRNEQYFEDWGASPQLSDSAHAAEDTAPRLARNGTDGRVYGGDPNLIHIVDGRRAALGQRMARMLEMSMRAECVGRTTVEVLNQPLCPGCYMVALFNMATELARQNGQSMEELGQSMAQAFTKLANGGTDAIEEIEVMLDPE